MATNPLLAALRKSPHSLSDFEDDDEAESLLSEIGKRSLSGLSKAGSLLDVPGAVIRNTLAGENPLAPFVHPLTNEGRVSGRDLLRRNGLVGSTDTWGNWASGFALDVGLDPLTYVGGLGLLKAPTKAGKIAKAAGVLGDAGKLTGKGNRVAQMTTTLRQLADKVGPESANALEEAAKKAGTTIDDVSNEPLSSLLRFEVPFTDIGVNVGTGPLSQRVAGALDTAGEAVRWSPLGRAAHGLFGPASKGLFDKGGQQLAEAVSAVEPKAAKQARKAVAEMSEPLIEAHKSFDEIFGADLRTQATGKIKDPTSHVSSVLNRVVGLTAELGGDVDTAMKELTLPLGKLTPDLRSKLVKLGDDMQKGEDDIADTLIAKGGMLTKMEGLPADATSPAFEHLTAYGAEKPATLGSAVKTLFTKPGAFSAREEVTKNIPREIVNQIVSSDEFRGRGATQKLLSKYGKYLGRGTKLADDGSKVPLWESADKHAKALVDFIKNRDQFPIYNTNQLENFGKYMKESHLASVNYDVIHETLARNLDDSGIPVTEVFSKAGMDPAKATEWLAKKVGIAADELAKKGVPEDVANAIVAVRKASSDPEWMGAIGGFIDSTLRMFKENVTLPFPSFWGRNLSSGQFVNSVSGLMETPADFATYKNALGQAWNGLRSGDSKLLSELYVEGVIDDRMLFEGVEATSGLGWSLGQVPNPLNVPQSFREASEEVAQNPFTVRGRQIPGVGTARAVHGTALKTGEKASAAVEFMNRAPMYLFLREKGFAPEVAAAKVKELHADYSNLSPFEKQVMRRIAPFYTWQRRLAPTLLGILAERPGGALAQTIRAASESSGADATTPEWIGSTAAVPNPFKTPAEGQSFLTGFGVPTEQFLQYGGGGLRGALREGLSQTNPMLKGPLEWATNQSFFQTGPSGAGRPLDDLDPVLGRTLANIAGRFGRESTKPIPTPDVLEWALSNSPLTRAASTLRQVTDPRKSPLDLALNLGTGVRVTDVSPQAQDAVLRDRALEMMKGMGSRVFAKSYFPKDELEGMPAPQRALAEKLSQLQSLLAERAKARREAAGR